MESARPDGLVWSGYDMKSAKWLKKHIIVDTGFTAGLFANLYEFTGKKVYKDFLEKFKEKKKITPKVKPDPDKKNTPIIPKDFFKDKRFFPEKFNPKNKRKFYENMPFKPDPDNKRPDMIPMPLPFDPNKKIPKMEPMPYKIKPSDKMPGVQLLKKGGTVKGYKAGGEVKTDKSPNSGMITKRGWGKSRKT